MKVLSFCPCGHSKRYSECCERLHLGVIVAVDALELMRSRYSAFFLQKIDYLIKTTALGQQAYLDRDAIAQWSSQNTWIKLDILDYQPRVTKQHASVEFKAHYCQQEQQKIHHELSFFVNHQGSWSFLDPTLDIKMGMKHPCVCGSEKKFKQCCAPFLSL